MTDLTTPGEVNAAVDNKSTAHAISKAGGHSGYVVEGVDIASFYPEIMTANLNGFAHVSTTGLDIVLDGGEAFVWGWLCRDRQTTITLPASATTRVCVGFNPDAVLTTGQAPTNNDNIILDVESAFTNGAPKLPLYEVTTTATAVSTINDVRPLGPASANSNTFATKALRTEYESFRSSGGAIGGPITIPRLIFDEGTVRILYDQDKTGDPIYIQRDIASTETALSIVGTNVGVGTETTPEVQLDVQGKIHKDGKDVVASPSGDYEIQKNGTDGLGVINFKT